MHFWRSHFSSTFPKSVSSESWFSREVSLQKRSKISRANFLMMRFQPSCLFITIENFKDKGVTKYYFHFLNISSTHLQCFLSEQNVSKLTWDKRGVLFWRLAMKHILIKVFLICVLFSITLEGEKVGKRNKKPRRQKKWLNLCSFVKGRL